MTTYTTDEALYKVVKLDRPMKIDANWDKEQWKNVIPVKIEKHMGDLPKFEPQVEAKMMYDQKNVYGIFRVKDRLYKAPCRNTTAAYLKIHALNSFFLLTQRIL